MSIMKAKTAPIKWLLFIVAIFFILGIIFAGGFLAWENYYQDKIYPGVKVGEINLGGKTKVEAKRALEEKITRLNQEGIRFRYKDQSMKLTPTVSSFSGGFAYKIIKFDVNNTVDRAFSYGRTESIGDSLFDQFQAWRSSYSIPLKVDIKKKEIEKTLKEKFQDMEVQPSCASLQANDTPSGIEFGVQEGRSGTVIDYPEAITTLEDRLNSLDLSSIQLSSKKQEPVIRKKECDNVKDRAHRLLESGPITLLVPIDNKDNASQEWTINTSQLATWIALKKKEGEVELGLDLDKIAKFLEDTVAPEVNKEPQKARFDIKDDKVVKFKASQKGIELDIPQSAKKIEKKFIEKEKQEVKLLTTTVESDIKAENVNELGIKEVIGTGHSNFAGSPPNRVHNIQVGAESLEGILIKPGEEFSLVEALGEINAESGYKPELVIKGNRTKPEYGGGLCQIATTMFRAALRSGLKITARTSHSYQVSYYKPTGMDATVYKPRPDLKFKNDTDNHVLIQYRIEGNDIFFDLWGADDGREVEISDPSVYNIKEPGPTKIVETTDLEPGERKCTESAHKGADAHFDYKIIYSDGEKRERRFHSHYVPWRKVCLVGKEGDSDNKKEGATTTPSTATSTEEDN